MSSGNSDCSGKHDCSEVISKIMLALDNELTVDQEKEFLTEVERCPHCFEKFSIEKSFKEFLFNKINNFCVSRDSVDKLRRKITRNILNSA